MPTTPTTQATRGPWRVDDDGEGDIYIETATARELIAMLTRRGTNGLEANARLIAAAPELRAFVEMIAANPYELTPDQYRQEANELLARIDGREEAK